MANNHFWAWFITLCKFAEEVCSKTEGTWKAADSRPIQDEMEKAMQSEKLIPVDALK